MNKRILGILLIACFGICGMTFDRPSSGSGSGSEPTSDALTEALIAQAAGVSTLPIGPRNQACEARYERMWAGGTLNISWFYGYIDQGDTVADQNILRHQIENLTRPCTPGLEACGFTLSQAQASNFDPVLLTRNLGTTNDPKLVNIRFWHASVHEQDHKNDFGLQKLIIDRKAQAEKTKSIWNTFKWQIHLSQVLIYDGHSRYGTGPGFSPFGVNEWLAGKVYHPTLLRLEKYLRQDGSKPELLVLAACESKKYYLNDVNAIVPKMAVAAAKYEQTQAAGEQVMVGLIDSILKARCQDSMNQAMIPATGNIINGGDMQVYGFDE